MTDTRPEYEERLTSLRTTLIFAGLGALFLALFVFRMASVGSGRLAFACLGLCGFFLFYCANYRQLVICVTPRAVRLRFGMFTKTVPRHAIEAAHIDRTRWWRVGGAGIHFTFIGRRYRMYLNFLEHPRLVLELRPAGGWVRAVAFSTRRPGELLAILAPAGRPGH